MQVNFTRTGGFAPMPMSCHLDTRAMAAADAQRLEQLVAMSDLAHARDARVPGARDVHIYTLEVIEDGQYHKLTFDQLSVPEHIKPLMDYLKGQAKSMLDED